MNSYSVDFSRLFDSSVSDYVINCNLPDGTQGVSSKPIDMWLPECGFMEFRLRLPALGASKLPDSMSIRYILEVWTGEEWTMAGPDGEIARQVGHDNRGDQGYIVDFKCQAAGTVRITAIGSHPEVKASCKQFIIDLNRWQDVAIVCRSKDHLDRVEQERLWFLEYHGF